MWLGRLGMPRREYCPAVGVQIDSLLQDACKVRHVWKGCMNWLTPAHRGRGALSLTSSVTVALRQFRVAFSDYREGGYYTKPMLTRCNRYLGALVLCRRRICFANAESDLPTLRL